MTKRNKTLLIKAKEEESCDIKELKKQIKSEKKINGNLSREFVFKHLDDAAAGWGMYNTNKMASCLSEDSEEIIEDMGYMAFAKISQLLALNDVCKEKFWREQFEITRL